MTNMEEKLTTLFVHVGYSIEDTYGAVSIIRLLHLKEVVMVIYRRQRYLRTLLQS